MPGQGSAVQRLKAHIDRRGGMALVLDFGLGKCRAAVRTPVNRLITALEMALADDLTEGTQNIGLGLRVHCQIRVLPVAQHTQALEVLALPGNLLAREIPTGIAKMRWCHGITGLADGLLHLVFNGQTVTVPTRHIDRVIAIETAGLDDNILENFVNGMADMNIAIGVGGAVMQDVALAAAAAGTQSLIHALTAPAGQAFGLAFGKTRAHGKRGFRKIESVLVIAHVFILPS